MTEQFSRRWEERGRSRRSRADAPRTAAQAAHSSYYGVPVIHKPHWRWLIIVYFFLGGLSGASYVIASIAELIDRQTHREVIRTGRMISFAALLPCPVLLVLDLQRPARFLNMLRVLKLRSPMSVGTWGLMIFSGFCGLSAAIEAAESGLFGRGRSARLIKQLPSVLIGTAGILPSFFMSGYTGVLLGATAVPLWAKNALLLGPLFVASALSSAASAISLVLAMRRTRGHYDTVFRGVESVERAAWVAEAGLLLASGVRLGQTSRPLLEGTTGKVMKFGAIGAGVIVPAVLQTANRRHARSVVVAASVLTLAGGVALRYAVVMAGRASADDPEATFDFTRGNRSA